MRLSTLQFGLCVSLAIHAALYGAIAFGGLGRRSVQLPIPEREQIATVTFLDAPEEPDAEAASKAAPVVAAVPAIETRPEPKEPIAAEPPPPPPPVMEPPIQALQPTPVPQPIAPVQTERRDTTPATQSAKPAPASDAIPSGPPTQNLIRGDGSSTHPSEDTTTRPATPGVRARPNYLKNPEPPYPLSARRRRQEGLVVLTVKVNAQGRATRVELKQSSGFEVLDEAAIQAVRSYEFTPARIGSTPVEDEAEVPVRFKLTP